MFIGEIPQEILDARAESEVESTCVPHWVVLSGVSMHANALYGILAAHHQSLPDMEVSHEDLAELLRQKDARQVGRWLKELEDLGAVEVRQDGDRTDYVVHYEPPTGYKGLLSVEDAIREMS
jgi:DNA-binding transcriptional ArsR family regulator